MTPAAHVTTAARRKLLAKVHVAAKQLGYDDDVYRSILERVTGERSARDLSDVKLVAVLDEFRKLGWEPKSAKGKRASDKPQVRMIWAIWNDMARDGLLKKPSRGALRSFVLRQTGIADPEWLDVRQATSVIQALKSWRNREAAKAKGPTK